MAFENSFSIIIAAYNAEKYIKRSILSALNQSAKDIEIIAVDDCSTDNTAQVIKALQNDEPRIKFYQHKTNKGPGGARNTAISLASKEWLVILDADDTIATDRLELLLKDEQNYDVILDNLCVVQKNNQYPMFDKQFVKDFCQPLTIENFIKGNIQNCRGFTLGYLKPIINRKFVLQHNITYNEKLRIGEDYILLIELLLKHAKINFVTNCLYNYHVNEDSISYRLSSKHLLDMLTADEYLVNKYGNDYINNNLQQQRMSNLRYQYAYNLIVEGLKTKSFFTIMKGIKANPLAVVELKEPILNRIKGY